MKHLLLIIFLVTIMIARSDAATFIITASVNWSAITGGPPSSLDSVIIKNGAVLTLDINSAVCRVLILGEGGTNAGNGRINFNVGSVLSVLSSSGQVILGSDGYTGTIDMSLGGTLKLMEFFHNSGTAVLIHDSGTIMLQPDSITTLPTSFATLYNLSVNGPNPESIVTIASNTSVLGTLHVLDGIFDTDADSSYSLLSTGYITVEALGVINANASFIELNGDLTVMGDFNCPLCEVSFDGSSKVINGLDSVYKLELKGSGNLTLMNDLYLDNRLKLFSGDLVLAAHTLTLGINCTFAGSINASSYIQADSTGFLRRNVDTLGSFEFPIGDDNEFDQFNIILNSATFGGSDYIEVNVTDEKHPAMGSGDYITRYWTINSGNFTAINYDVNYTYQSVDTVGSEANMNTARWDGSIWTEYDAVFAPGNQFSSSTNITAMASNHAFSGGSSTALPIQLTYFEADVTGDKVDLTWVTASEINCNYFIIERSTDGNEFENIASIISKGGSYLQSDYRFTDINPPARTIYYRLTSVDKNGERSEFGMVSARIDNQNLTGLAIYPNPSYEEEITIQLTGFNFPASMVITNAVGQKISSFVLYNKTDDNMISYSLDKKFDKGVYFLTVSNQNQQVKQKFLVK